MCNVQREASVKRPPSLDYKPRRSESEAPIHKVSTAIKAVGNADGKPVSASMLQVRASIHPPEGGGLL
jgi:hypothetical protein